MIIVQKLCFKEDVILDIWMVNIEEFNKMLENGEFVPTLEFDENDYKKCLELLGE